MVGIITRNQVKKTHGHGFDETAENMIKKVKQALANGEGCWVYGVLDVQRVAENFHISVHGLNIFVFYMVVGWAPIRAYKMNTLVNLATGPGTQDDLSPDEAGQKEEAKGQELRTITE